MHSLFQIVAFAGFAEIGAMPAAQYTGGPQNLPGGYDGSVGTIPGGYPFTTQIEDVTARNRALTCELQNGRAAMLGTFGAMCHSARRLGATTASSYPITHSNGARLEMLRSGRCLHLERHHGLRLPP